MWGCNFYSNIPLMQNQLSNVVFSLFFCGVILFLLIMLILQIVKKISNSKDYTGNDKRDSFEILKFRYAKGEINRQEFNKMKQVL